MMLMMMREKSCGRGTRYLRSDAFIHQTHLWLIVVARTVNIHTKKAKKKRKSKLCHNDSSIILCIEKKNTQLVHTYLFVALSVNGKWWILAFY